MKRLKMGEMALPCFACGKELYNFSPYTDNQPQLGTEFRGGGDYGSRVTDIPEKVFILNICDGCIEEGLADKRVKKIKR